MASYMRCRKRKRVKATLAAFLILIALILFYMAVSFNRTASVAADRSFERALNDAAGVAAEITRAERIDILKLVRGDNNCVDGIEVDMTAANFIAERMRAGAEEYLHNACPQSVAVPLTSFLGLSVDGGAEAVLSLNSYIRAASAVEWAITSGISCCVYTLFVSLKLSIEYSCLFVNDEVGMACCIPIAQYVDDGEGLHINFI